jgi:LCP family protein required for cell wall assembly
LGRAAAEPPPSPTLAAPTGKPWAPPIPFATTEAVPEKPVFILVAGSDARPNEDLLHTRADSLHLLCVNPATGQGTLLGFPRDSWVEIPGHGRGKINNALALGGPDLLAATVRRLTGLPVDYYVITGFPGLMTMVDELGGVDVFVDRRMNDRNSGARFQRGWHHFTGGEALAFSRDRTDVERGDLTRSEHQGLVMLAALAKMRAEVADDAGVARWIGVLVRHARLDVPLAKLPALGALDHHDRGDGDVVPGVVALVVEHVVEHVQFVVEHLDPVVEHVLEHLELDVDDGHHREPRQFGQAQARPVTAADPMGHNERRRYGDLPP